MGVSYSIDNRCSRGGWLSMALFILLLIESFLAVVVAIVGEPAQIIFPTALAVAYR